MANVPTHDIVVKTGEYQGADGQTKGRYKNIGTVFEGNDGRPFIMLDASVLSMSLQNIVNRDGRERVACSMFEKVQRDQGQGYGGAATSPAASNMGRERGPAPPAQGQPQQQRRQQQPQPPQQDSGIFDDDIPF